MPRRRKANGHAQLPVVKIFSALLDRPQSFVERLADMMTESFGTVSFLTANIIFFLAWIVVNLGWIPGVVPFDAFPFGLLTMFVSLEAIILSIIVLISQNKAANIEDIRAQVDFQVNVQAEKEITKILTILDHIQHRLRITHEDDPELEEMKKTLDLGKIERGIIKSRKK